MPNGSLEFSFTESLYTIPREGGRIEAGELNGIAEISYDADGQWCVESISLDGWDTVERKFIAKISVPENSEVYRVLLDRLHTGRTLDYIQSEVEQAIEEDRQPDPDYERERRRDDAREFAS